MPLATVDRLCAYEIVPVLGKGGMGEVWKGHDPRLNRDVAIKASAQQFTDRFEREPERLRRWTTTISARFTMSARITS